ncbi:histidine kinase-like protein [Roseimicrobium gellanilyticum]|uniref:Histidine kinase-like protein n=1 Tax=Roseimicrobium gellanilyticum TaxID=748857 RepID=A0A366HMR0_9BACT|nr:sensor histidine kinase [Roseimicrobium gellanilyticum]RBP43612.1 histidine kinase-like protein [Roseimicrobium gellanilyticum]
MRRIVALLLWGGWAMGVRSEESIPSPSPAPVPVEMLVDGKPFSASQGIYNIPALAKSVGFRLGKSALEDPEGCRRMRFKLDGVDEAWRQMSSEMCFIVRFADAAGDQVWQRRFSVDGISTGWHGEPETSTFTPRQETVRVPTSATSMTIAISSSGPPTAMGIYVVQALKITGTSPSGRRVVYEAGSSAGEHPSIADGWGRSGTRPSMARLVSTSTGESFCILDDDPGTHAEWNLSRAGAPRVEPGEVLTIEWSEMYDIGMGNRFDVNYGNLSPGTYLFWSEELDATGKTLTGPRSLSFVVLQPFWKRAWFWAGGLMLVGALLWLACRAIIRRRIYQHLSRLEQERVVEQERLRIARDLHDDLGARLTHISLMSGLAENEPQSAASRENFQRISSMARELVAALYQTVWTVNPEHDHLEALVDYLCQLTQTFCDTAKIRCRIHSCEVPGERPVSSEVRHNVTLAVKEALHNAIKHASATEITVRMEFADPHLTILVSDNGRGFDSTIVAPGNGLDNMARRMKTLGGTVSLQGAPHEGTTVRFEVSIPAAPSKRSPAT